MEHNNYYIAAQFSKGGYANVGSGLGVALDGSSEFTVESWIRVGDLAGGIDLLSCAGYFRFGVDGEKLSLEIVGLPVVSGSSATRKIDTSDWHHVAATYGKQYLRLYIDGECVVTASFSGRGSGTAGAFRIGERLDGRIRRLRLYKRGLFAEEVHDSMFGDVAASDLVADFDFTSNPPVDRKSPSRSITFAEGARSITAYPSLRLSNNAFATPSVRTGINPGGGNLDPYTVHAVLRVDKIRGRQIIFANSLPQIDSGMALYLEYDATSKKMRVVSLRGSTIEEGKTLVSQSLVSLDSWVSIATVYDGEKLSIYIDGVKDSEKALGPVLVSAYEGNPVIGGRFLGDEPTATDSLQGYVSRLEVWDRALSADEVRTYADRMPSADTPSLTCLFDFSVYHVRNEVDYAPVAMSDGAIISEFVSTATDRATEHHFCENRVTWDVDPALLQSFRSKSDLSFEQNSEQRFHVTQHREGKEFFLVVHLRDHSYVAYRCGIDRIDECSLLKVRLIFTLVVGVTDILLGARPTLTDRAVTYIQRNILTLPQITTALAGGTDITASKIFSMLVLLVSKGFLKELLKIILTLGFWSLVRLAARLILSFLGVGSAAMVASLAATAITFTIVMYDFLKQCLPFPTVALYGIKFNHDLSQNQTTTALNIRVSQGQNIRIPEWSPSYQDPVAYAINRVALRGVVIHAKFSSSALMPTTINIRANARPGSVLGNIASFPCAFSAFSSNYVPLAVPFIGAVAVGTGVASWDWEYFDSQANQWRAMGPSSNNVYLTLNAPSLPWTQTANLAVLTLPSEQALRLACRWANGTGNAAAIPPLLAQSFHNDPRFVYLPIGAYTGVGPTGVVSFSIHRFLDDYNNVAHNVDLECTDCAGVVAVFCRLLGVPVNVLSLIDPNGIQTTFIKAIGVPGWATHNFGYHVLNTTAAALVDGSPVIDACVQVNGDNNPWPVAAPVPAVAFVPGSPGRAMSYTTQVPAAVVPTPYTATNSYRERFFVNNAVAKVVNQRTTYTNFQLRDL